MDCTTTKIPSLIVTKVEANLVMEENLIAIANIVFNGEFMVRNIRVVKKQDGKFLMCMPSRKNKAGDFKEMAHPLNQECRNHIEAAVIPKVDGLLKQFEAKKVNESNPQLQDAAIQPE